jgi:C1A family cysteine protease
MALELLTLQKQISELKLGWVADTTVNSANTLLQAQSRCGAVPPAGTTLEARKATAAAAPSAHGAPATAPAAWDWRSARGGNYVTPIVDQGGCGSCVAFGTIATFEAQAQISLGNPTLGVDLSEAHLWFCYGPPHGAGACPNGGWWPDDSFPGLIPGIVPGAAYPYTDANQACKVPADASTELTAITAWETLSSQAAIKEFISTTGPVTVCFSVYEDFYHYYKSGVYEYNANTSGARVGGHCVSLVGYNDDGQYWIAKNSWGSGWGESGYFQIGYGQCGIDSEAWAIDGAVVSTVWPLRDRAPGLAEFDGELVAAWKGLTGDDGLYHASFNGTSWTPQAEIPNVKSSVGPSLAVFDGKLYAAWKGMNSDERLWFSSYNGSTWAAQAEIPGVSSSYGPSLAVFDGKLYAAWKGMGLDQRLWFSSYNGSSWAAQAEIPGVQSSVGPSLAVFDGKLYAAWKGMSDDQGLWWSSFNGTSWAGQQEIPGVASSIGPSLAVFDGKLYAAWKGMSDDQGLYWSSFNGTSWAAQKEIPGDATSEGPSLAVSGPDLYAVWKGMNADEGLYWASFNGTSWAAQKEMAGVGTGPDAA